METIEYRGWIAYILPSDLGIGISDVHILAPNGSTEHSYTTTNPNPLPLLMTLAGGDK